MSGRTRLCVPFLGHHYRRSGTHNLQPYTAQCEVFIYKKIKSYREHAPIALAKNERDMLLYVPAHIGNFFYEPSSAPLFFWDLPCAILWCFRQITLKKRHNISLEH